MDYFAPDEVIEGIARMEDGGETQEQILLTIVLNFETQAKHVLTEKGYAPDFETHYYVPKKGLTEQEIRADTRQWKYYKWVNEATQLIGHGDFLIDKAANTILEAGSLRHFIELGETKKAAVSMAILLSCGFLHDEHHKLITISSLRNRPAQAGGDGGRAGKGKIAANTAFITKLHDSLYCNRLTPSKAATRILNCLLDEKGAEYYSCVEQCKIEITTTDRDEKEIHYFIKTKPDSKKAPFTHKTIERIVRTIREK